VVYLAKTDEGVDIEIAKMFREDVRDKKNIGRNIFNRAATRKGKISKMMFPVDFMSKKDKKEYIKGGKVMVSNIYTNFEKIEDVPSIEQIRALPRETGVIIIKNARSKFTNDTLRKHWNVSINYLYSKLFAEYVDRVTEERPVHHRKLLSGDVNPIIQFEGNTYYLRSINTIGELGFESSKSYFIALKDLFGVTNLEYAYEFGKNYWYRNVSKKYNVDSGVHSGPRKERIIKLENKDNTPPSASDDLKVYKMALRARRDSSMDAENNSNEKRGVGMPTRAEQREYPVILVGGKEYKLMSLHDIFRLKYDDAKRYIIWVQNMMGTPNFWKVYRIGPSFWRRNVVNRYEITREYIKNKRVQEDVEVLRYETTLGSGVAGMENVQCDYSLEDNIAEASEAEKREMVVKEENLVQGEPMSETEVVEEVVEPKIVEPKIVEVAEEVKEVKEVPRAEVVEEEMGYMIKMFGEYTSEDISKRMKGILASLGEGTKFKVKIVLEEVL
jgi:hypothetical protein